MGANGGEKQRPAKAPTERSELGELQSLLLGRLPGRLQEVEDRVGDGETLTQNVSDVLAHAVSRRPKPDRQLARALMPTVEQALTTSVRRDPKTLIDAIFPILGPAIRKSIAQALSSLVEGINRGVEAAFTPRGIRWRLEAWRTGRSYGEVVLAHSYAYRVEHAYLIHRDTGLLLKNVGLLAPAAEDPDVVSGMFTAIQDFVRDAFRTGNGGSLDQVQIGGLTLLAENGPRALLAVVVRGVPPPRLTNVMQETLEKVHAEWRRELEAFRGDSTAFEATEPVLEECLLVEERPQKKSRAGPIVLAAAGLAVVLLLVLGWVRGRTQEARWADYVRRLEAQPGLLVLSTAEVDDRLQVRGLRDPLAADPVSFLFAAGLTEADVDGRWDTYFAGDPCFVTQRARQALDPPETVTLRFEDGVLHAEGVAPARWFEDAARLAPLLPGVRTFSALPGGAEEQDAHEGAEGERR